MLKRKLFTISCIGLLSFALFGCGSNTTEEVSEESVESSVESTTAADDTTADDATTEDDSSTSTEDENFQGTQDGEFGGNFGGGNGGGMIDKSDDEELQSLIAEVEGEYQQIDYTDEETGESFTYNIYIPEDYDASVSYPLVLFITDSSVVGQDTTMALEQGYGGIIWASESEQEKHPSIIVVPEYPENILDGESDVTDYVTATVNLLAELQETYSIDADRLYMTGQSMGCMTALYLNATYPDLFAATLYVDGQWPVDELSALEDQSFIYFAAEGDEASTEGMNEVIAMLSDDGVEYGEVTVDAKADEETIEGTIQDMLDEGYNNNFVHWTAGSVLPDGVSSEGANEHMYSFDHAFQVEAARDWLFEQSK